MIHGDISDPVIVAIGGEAEGLQGTVAPVAPFVVALAALRLPGALGKDALRLRRAERALMLGLDNAASKEHSLQQRGARQQTLQPVFDCHTPSSSFLLPHLPR